MTNKINGKTYIGQTIQSVSRRIHRHSTGPYAIGNAIRKYGIDNFKVEVLFNSFDVEMLNEAEKQLIKNHNTMYPNGYNLMEGGQIRMSQESIEKMRKSKTGSKQSKETIEKRMTNIRKSVICNETGEVFKSIVEAGRNYSISPSHISAQCRGKYKGKLKMKTFNYYKTGGALSHS